MKSNYWKIIIPAFVVLVNSYVFLGGFVKNNFAIQGETRSVYRILTSEITSMNGEYKQYGGQIIHGFKLEINLESSINYNKARIFNKIESLGFNLKSVEKNNFYLFCKGKSGFLIVKEPTFQIVYENDMSDCVN